MAGAQPLTLKRVGAQETIDDCQRMFGVARLRRSLLGLIVLA
jgi:hypothetical protein